MTTTMRSGTRRPAATRVWAGLLSALLALSPAGGAAQGLGLEEDYERGAAGTPNETVWQAASWLATIPYGAAKLAVAAVGGFVGGLGYVLSGGDLESSQQIWSSTLDGTYVLAPEHLRGEKRIIFFVPPEGPPQPAPEP